MAVIDAIPKTATLMQSDIARLFGVSPSVVAKWANDGKIPFAVHAPTGFKRFDVIAVVEAVESFRPGSKVGLGDALLPYLPHQKKFLAEIEAEKTMTPDELMARAEADQAERDRRERYEQEKMNLLPASEAAYTLTDAKRRATLATAKLNEMRLERMRGVLVSRANVGAVWGQHMAETREAVLSVRSRIAARMEAELEPKVLENLRVVVDDEARTLLNRLADGRFTEAELDALERNTSAKEDER